MSRLTNWLSRWQEYLSWTPLLVLLSLIGWLAFGALDRRLGTDALAFLLELPIRTAYAAAALGIAYLARRRQRRTLTAEEQADLWNRTLNGERGALIIYLTDFIVWALAFTLSLYFFLPAR